MLKAPWEGTKYETDFILPEVELSLFILYNTW